MTREELIATFAVQMTVAQMADDDGATMMAVINKLIDDAERRGRDEAAKEPRHGCLGCAMVDGKCPHCGNQAMP
jgi:hypothetical protein